MCGLVGMAGRLDYKDEEPLQAMMMMNWFRGKHSTGLAAVRPSGDVKIAKQVTDPIGLFEFPKFKEALNGNASCVFLAHARAATKGAINNHNAHPFKFDHIVGAHNGTLFGSSQDNLEKEIGEKYPVDSMAIIASIAAIGIKETVKLLEGSWAITWVDLQEGTMNFLRNKERPLCFGKTDDHKILYWGSEWRAMAAAVDSSAHRDVKRSKDGNRFFEFPPDVHYKYDISSLMKGEDKGPTTTKMEGKERFLGSVNGSFSVIENDKRTSDPFRRRAASQTTLTMPSHLGSRHLTMTVEGTEDQPYGGVVHRDEFEVWAYEGCSFCQAPVKWGDKGITIYVRDGIVLCHDHSMVTRDKTRIFAPDITERVVHAEEMKNTTTE